MASCIGYESSLESAELVSRKLFAICGEVCPEGALPTNGAGALDAETDYIWWIGWRWKIYIPPWHIRSSIVGQWEQIDVYRLLGPFGFHSMADDAAP